VIGQLSTIVIDCPEPLVLARFYSELLGLPITHQDDDWVDVGDGQPRLAFQLAPDHQAPRWPDPAHPQQFHLEVRVEDVELAEKGVLAIGATRLPGGGEEFRVYADPAGHPFCLTW